MNFNKYPTNGPVDTWIFLPLAGRLSPLLHACRLTPNAVTTLSLLAGLLALLCYWQNQSVAAVVLLLVYYLLDCADGILARTYGLTSDFGEVYDYLKDMVLFVILAAVILLKWGAWTVPLLEGAALYLMAWEGVMDCRACYNRHGHYDVYAVKARRHLFRPYLAMMYLCSRIGRPIVNWPLHWLGSGELVALAAILPFLPGKINAAASGG
ncbi:MAG: CDP-alcohol phosphatidyltransferase family protein [Planctomycetes bacterium]|nr:CDP-alcohol phosphatidyltransferase family protein [Planctomycetota bacterium]